MPIERLDLNLIAALDALLAEQSVTRAANKLGLSQPAMSGALSRLREHFGDPLITRSGRAMVLTAFGATLAKQSSEMLSQIGRFARLRPSFDPATADRQFTLVASDYALSLLLPLVMPRITAAAPGIALHSEVRAPDYEQRLMRGGIDLAMVPGPMAPRDFPTLPLFDDEYVCIAWTKNKAIGRTLSLEQFLSLGHVARVNRASPAPTQDELRISQQGYRRRLVLSVPSFDMLPGAVVKTPLVATMQRRLAEMQARHYPIRIFAHPVSMPPLQMSLLWPRFLQEDAGNRWLRRMFLETVKQELGAPGAGNARRRS